MTIHLDTILQNEMMTKNVKSRKNQVIIKGPRLNYLRCTPRKRLVLLIGLLSVISMILFFFTSKLLLVEKSTRKRRPLTLSDHENKRFFFQKQLKKANFDQQKVVNMTKHAWKGYIDFGNWQDALDAEEKSGYSMAKHDMAYTLVDSLDTLFILGLHEEFDQASQWISTHLERKMIDGGVVSFFETTIRSLGGLLSAYYLSEEKHFLHIADALGEALAEAFQCGMNVPCAFVDLMTGETSRPATLAEASTFQLEFMYLSNLTGKEKYRHHVQVVNQVLEETVLNEHPDGLLPVNMDWQVGRGFPSRITFGSNGDSYYEYLLKQWLLTDKTDDKLKHQYELAIESMISKMLGRSNPSGWMFLGELSYLKLKAQMEHLTCFVPGMLALGFLHGMPSKHLEIAQELLETCVKMYTEMASGLAPEVVHFHTDQSKEEETKRIYYGKPQASQQQQEMDMYVLSTDDYNLLRPEVLESLFILYQVTKDKKYQRYGRQIMEAIEKNCRVYTGGYRNTAHVFKGPLVSQKKRSMESFFISETLKYLYLLFADMELLPLKEMVLNTEAHPFPIIYSKG